MTTSTSDTKPWTPGPWGCVYTSNHAHDYRLTRPNGSLLPLSVEANDHSEQRANARLIAAAPDLAEVVRRVVEIADATGEQGDLAVQARAALAKAGAL